MSKLFISLALVSLSLCVYGQDSKKADDLLERGLRSHEKGDYAAAIEDFTQVIEITAGLRPARDSKQRKNFAETVDEAAQRANVSVVDPRTAAAYINRGNTYFFMGKVD